MQADITKQLTLMGYLILFAVALFFVRIILSIVLKNRFAPGLAPGLMDAHPQGFFARIIALIGHQARVTETLGTIRLRATFGLQLAYWLGTCAIALFHVRMQAPALGIESLLLSTVFLTALHTSLYEITYDRHAITLPRWWFGKTTHKWSDLLAVITKDPWFLTFVFEGGTSVKVHKYIVGYARLMDTARKVMRES